MVALVHAKVAVLPPDPAAEINPANWNAAHSLPGGTTGQVLTKNSNTDNDFDWAAGGGGGGAGDMLSILTNPAIAITAAAIATLDRMHICTGTTANYTLGLPTAVGNAGKFIGVRMGLIGVMSKLVTLDGNAAETIDGVASRIMWAGESAILMSDGTEWKKISGLSIPMMASIYLAADTANTVNATVTAAPLDTVSIDNTGAMANVGASKITLLRNSPIHVFGQVGITNTGNPSLASAAYIKRNAAYIGYLGSEQPINMNKSFPVNCILINGVAGDDIIEYYSQASGLTTPTLSGGIANSFLQVVEVPNW